MSVLMARCSVDGIPVQQGSMKGFVVPGRGGARSRAVLVSDNKAPLRDWRSQVAYAARSQTPSCFVSNVPVLVVARFRLPRPKSARKSASGVELAAKRPDLDKLLRALLDALTGVWFTDDALVVEVACSKVVCAVDERPGVDVELWQLSAANVAARAAAPGANLFGRESTARAADDRPF